MKSLNVDILVSPEIGVVIFIIGVILIFFAQRKLNKEIDIDKIPIINPHIIKVIGFFALFFGFIQCLPLVKYFF